MIVSKIEWFIKTGSVGSSFAEAYKPVIKKIVDRTTALYTILFREVIADLETVGLANYASMLTAGASHQTNGIIGASPSIELLTELSSSLELMVFKSRKEELSRYVDFVQELQKYIP